MATDNAPMNDVSTPRLKQDFFTKWAANATRATGSRWAFLCAAGTLVVWACSGPIFHYSEMWQLVINTGTSLVTFLMVFLIQNAQNRESKAVHIKLDELIFALKQARNEVIDIEHLTEDQLDRLGERYSKVAAKHQHKLAECFDDAEQVRETCEQARETAQEVREEIAEVREAVNGRGREPHMTVK